MINAERGPTVLGMGRNASLCNASAEQISTAKALHSNRFGEG